VRLLLDAHVSSRRIGAALRSDGHDVVAVDELPALEACSDETINDLAAAEERLLVSFDVRDFANIARAWAEAGRHHSGILLLAGLGHGEFGLIIRRIDAALTDRGNPADWTDVTSVYGPGPDDSKS
jgi:predicted nuclease of predicted toxin-antitoxin system